jgi:WD40 repeat protein/beta-lactamase regulating signal transducer with metallopeptidase domain/peroxiredoxin
MNTLLPLFLAIYWRATWLMLAALMLAGLLQRCRPLAAASILTAALAGLLALPILFEMLPALPIAVVKMPLGGAAGTTDNGPRTIVGERKADRAIPDTDAGAVSGTSAQVTSGAAATGGPAESSKENVSGPRMDAEPQVHPQPSPQATASSRLWHGATLLAIVYLAGVVILAARLAAAFRLVHRLRKTAFVVRGEWLDGLVHLQTRLEIRRRVELLATESVDIPMTVGCWRPTILLPKRMLDSPQHHRDAVLLHELAHIRRNDFVGVVMLQLAQMLYWCHPLVWVLGLTIRHLRERACDDLCVYWMGTGRVYRHALLEIASHAICAPRVAIGLAMMRTSRLSRRIFHIDRSQGCRRCTSTAAARLSVHCGMMIFTALTVAIQFVPAQAVGQVATKKAPSEPAADGAQANQPATAKKTPDTIPTYERAQAALENRGQAPGPLAAILGSSRLRHWSYVNRVAWSPDGSLLGSVGGDGCLRLWNADTGEQIKRFKSEPAWEYGARHLTSLAFDPTGKRVAAGLSTNAVRIWDIETAAETHFLKEDSPVLNVAWHPTRPLLATGGELLAKLWDLSTGKVVSTLDPQDKSFKRQSTTDSVHVAFSADGASILVGHPDGSVRFWDVATREVTRTIKAHDVAIQATALDGRRDLLATGDANGKIRVWRLSTGDSLREIQAHKHYVQGLALHPRQNAIYSGGLDGMVRMWDLATGEKLLEWTASRHIGPSSLALHPSRDLMASAGFAVRLWDSTTGKPHPEAAGHLGGIQALKFTPDGSRLITAGNDVTVRVWDIKNPAPLAAYDFESLPADSIDLTPNGKLLVTLNRYQGTVDIRYLNNGVLLNSFKVEGRMNEAVVVSPDGRWLVVASQDGIQQSVLTIWDLANNALHGRIQTHGGRPHFSRDGSQLLVVGSEYRFGGSAKSHLSVWDVEGLKSTLSLEDVQGLSRINASTLAVEGAMLVLAGTAFDQDAKSRNQLVFWDWTKNETRLVVDMGKHRPDNVALSPDGQSLLTTSALDGEARVWDPRDGTLREKIQLCEAGHWAIGPSAFAVDSRQVAIAMGNGTIYLVQIKEPPPNVAAKTAVPARAEEPDPDPWKALIGQKAPEFQAEGWLFGDPTTLEALRGKWVALYFWTDAFSDQDMPAWIDVQQRFGNRAPTAIVVYPAFGDSVDKLRTFFDHHSRESWGGRQLPFRVVLDKSQPNTIPGTRIETGGATFASYRVMNAWRGYRTRSLGLLIDPDGILKRQISSRPTVRELENLTGMQASNPQWEKELLEEYTLPAGEDLRIFRPPYSKAREDFRFFNNHGLMQGTMTFQQDKAVRQRSMTTDPEPSFEFVLTYVLGFKSYEFIDPDHVLERKVAGDWCWRAGAPRAKLLEALEKVARNELGWKLHFEQVTANQPVVVASGKWQQKPLPGLEGQPGIFLTVDDLPDPVNGGGGSGSLDEMFGNLGDRLRFRFVNEATDVPEGEMRWQDRLASHMLEIRKQTASGKEQFERLLNSLRRQTGLAMEIEEREVTAWRIIVE